jgi:hypothetical protein
MKKESSSTACCMFCSDANSVSMESADIRMRNQGSRDTTTTTADASHSYSDNSEESFRRTGIRRREVTSGVVHLPSMKGEQGV